MYHAWKYWLIFHAIGRLNQEELSLRINPFIYASSQTLHLHNQFLAGIYTNTHREPPETDIAPFVSSQIKQAAAATASKPPTGDAAEQQLKAEIMALPARERHRLKQLADQGQLPDEFLTLMKSIRDKELVKPPDVVPTSAGGFNKTNWELEIGKRFELPLFTESNEFPGAEDIQKRMTPLCYQEGLAGGAGRDAADLINVATEMFIKQLLSDSFRRTRVNGANYIQTASFRKRLNREEAQLARGFIKRDGFGLLPIEHEVERQRAPFGVEDLRFSMMLGGNHLVQNKLLAAKILTRPLLRMENKDLERKNAKAAAGRLVNGINGHSGMNGYAAMNGIGHGGPVQKVERTGLDDTLDEILDF
jgi:transcriptional coactivator HFI1/ADA1